MSTMTGTLTHSVLASPIGPLTVVAADGALSGGEVVFNVPVDDSIGPGNPDGMKLDEHGNIYVTGPGGVWVFSAEGEHLGTIEVPEDVGNVNWGGDDWQTLYIPATTSLYRVRLKVSGNRLGYMR